MKRLLPPGPRRGAVSAPASKSHTQRLLICAALSGEESRVRCGVLSRDVLATVRCLRSLGAEIREEGEWLRVFPLPKTPAGECVLPCGESGATLRLLLPVVGALGASAVFLREGRLPQRPLAPLDRELSSHGMRLETRGKRLHVSGKLLPGEYRLPGDVTSQFFSGLLLALPLLDGESRVVAESAVESAPYLRMTGEVLRSAGVALFSDGPEYRIPGGQRPAFSGELLAEGDWSGASVFLCMGALSPEGIRVEGLRRDSCQGDRAILELLRAFGAQIREEGSRVLVRRGSCRPMEIDAADVPDLVPALSVLAAGAEGESRILRAGRLRLKESDRLRSLSRLLRDLGGEVREREDGLTIRGCGALNGGRADSAADHRVAMAAALAACLCREETELAGAECVEKSYPRFWEDFESLKGGEP